MILKLTAFIGVSACVAALIVTPLIRAAAIKHGFVDQPGERKIHQESIAYGGGFVIALAMLAAMLLGIFIEETWLKLTDNRDDIQTRSLYAIAIGATGALLLGWADDRFKLRPSYKLVGQLVLAICAVAHGVRITALIGDNLLMQTVTVCWIVLITNSFNLLDNMDGLCTGVVAIAAAMLGILALDGGQWRLALALAALAGACTGFLKYNYSPASIFLGDAGSLFMGYLMACFTVLTTYYRYRQPSHLAIGIPILILAIPLYDTLSVIFIRLKERRPIMLGDTSHFSHRLTDLGMTRRQAVATIHLACLAIGLPAIVLGQLSEAMGLLIVAQAILVLTIIALLERAGRNRVRLERERSGGTRKP